MDWITAKIGEYGHGAFSRAWRAKNIITLHSIPLLIIPSLIHYLCACEGGLYEVIALTTGLDIGMIQIIASFLFFQCGFNLKTAGQWSLKDGTIRFLILLILTFLTSITLVSLEYPSLFQQRKDNRSTVSTQFFALSGLFVASSFVAFLFGVMIAKVFNLQIEEERWTMKRILAFGVIHVIIAVLIFICLIVLLVPVALLNQEGFNETYKIITYGILFPLLKLGTGRLVMFGVSLGGKVGLYHDPTARDKITISLFGALNVFFGTSSLFCMFNNTSSLDFFALQIICHSFVGKVSWLYSIPWVKARIDKLIDLLTCCCQRRAVVVIANAPSKRTSAFVRRLSGALVVMDMTQLPIEGNNLPSVDIENNALLNATIVELAEMLIVKMAAFLSFPSILSSCFSLQANTSFSGWFICIVGITFCLDQFVGVGGFMAFEMNGSHIDPNFHLGSDNPFNPIRRLRSGNNKVAAVKDIIIWSFFIMVAYNAIGGGSRLTVY